MKKLSTKQAAFLYLLNFNIEESGNPAFDDLLFLSRTILKTGGYEEDPGYDHDGGPLIAWDLGFDYEKFIMNPNFDEAANHEDLHRLDPDETWKGYLKSPIQEKLDLLFNDWKGVDLNRVLELIDQIN